MYFDLQTVIGMSTKIMTTHKHVSLCLVSRCTQGKVGRSIYHLPNINFVS